jgi:tRNA-specific 2-thiouridylase
MRVVVALSGGIDSSVAAALLQQQGHEVIGMTLRLFEGTAAVGPRSCGVLSGVADARAVAGRLGIPYHVVDGQERFAQRVLRLAWQQYASGRTPNPCVVCNAQLKFGLLGEQARELGAQRVASGHHARLRDGQLWRGRDPDKDQSYFLFALDEGQRRNALLPVGELTKRRVRELARELGLPNAERPESQDACIAQGGNLAETLRRRFDAPSAPGVFVDPTGRVLGEHDGVHRFTVGQRKGLGLALGQRAYVVAIDAEQGRVLVDSDEGALGAGGLEASGMCWHEPPREGQPLEVEVQIRYRHRPVPARLIALGDDTARVLFVRPERAVTPGQAVVCYQGERVVAGGWIDRPLEPAASAGQG